MNRKVRTCFLAALTIFDVLFIVTPIFAQKKITLNELYRTPEAYYGTEVKLWGRVEDVYYNGFILRSDIGWEVEILTEELPQITQELEVTVWVDKSKSNSIPVLRMVKKQSLKENKYWMYMGGVFVVILLLKVLPD